MKELRAREAKALSEEDYELGEAVCMHVVCMYVWKVVDGSWLAIVTPSRIV